MSAEARVAKVQAWADAITEPLMMPRWALPESVDEGGCYSFDVPQGDPIWYLLRCGLPTTSALHRIMTEKRRGYAAGARSYIAELLAEELMGQPTDWGSSTWTERGHGLEGEARRFYEAMRGVDVRQVGFLMSKDGREGGSPDGLVGEQGGVEIKCYGAKHHTECLLGITDVTKDTQVQGLMRLTGREWWDVLAYNPDLPPVLYRVKRNEDYIGALDECLTRFHEEREKAQARLDTIGPGGRIDEDDLLRQLAASIREKKKGDDAPLGLDEIDEFNALVKQAREAGGLDEQDVAGISADIAKGRWDDVRAMRTHVRRVLNLETLEVVS